MDDDEEEFRIRWDMAYLVPVFAELFVKFPVMNHLRKSPRGLEELYEWILKIDPSPPSPQDSPKSMLKTIQGYVGDHINRLSRFALVDVLKVYGYDGLRKMAKGGYADIFNISVYNGRPARLVAKIMSLESSTFSCCSGLIWNEIAVATYFRRSPYFSHIKNIMFSGSGEKYLVDQVCVVQHRYAENLSQALKNEYCIGTEAKICQGILDIMGAVCEMHDRGFLHLDLKPFNVLGADRGRYILCDFGLSIRMLTQSTLDARKVTLWYRPPELIVQSLVGHSRIKYGKAVDVWSMGMMMLDFLLPLPYMNSVRLANGTEGPSEYYQSLGLICGICGEPTESDMLSWGCTPSAMSLARVYFGQRAPQPPSSLVDYVYAHGREIVRQFTSEFIHAICGVVESALRWNPSSRPPMSYLWAYMNEILYPLECFSTPKVSFETGIDLENDLSSEEKTWRVRSISRLELERWWDESLSRVVWLVSHTKENTPAIFTSEEDRLDIIIMSLELWMRVLYQESMEECKTRDADVSMRRACFGLAVQLTRPVFNVLHVSKLFSCSVHEIQRCELYISRRLGYNLYIDDILCRALHRGQTFTYTEMRELYINSNSHEV